MNECYPPIHVDATPDDILAILRDSHRQQCSWHPETDSEIVLTHESTIGDWRQACDLLGWRRLAEGMNKWLSVDIPLEQWRDVLEPAKDRKLRAVCELLAQHMKLPRVRPARLLGAECLPAGVFLTVRSYLAAAGADADKIGPSTPLAEYTRRYPGVFLGEVSRLAPGALPTVRIRTPLFDGCGCAWLLAFAGIIVGSCAGWHVLTALSAIVAIFAYLGIWFADGCVLPASGA